MQSKFGTGASYFASTEWLEMTDKGKYQSTVETSGLQEAINSLPSGWAKDGTYKGENLGLGDAISSYTDFPHRGPGNQATATHEPTDDRYALILLLPLNQSNSNCDSVIHEQPQSSDSEEFADNARMQTPLKGSKGTAQINCKHVLSPTDRPTPAKEVCSGREYNTDNVSISLTDAAGGTTSTCTKLGELEMDLVKASHACIIGLPKIEYTSDLLNDIMNLLTSCKTGVVYLPIDANHTFFVVSGLKQNGKSTITMKSRRVITEFITKLCPQLRMEI